MNWERNKKGGLKMYDLKQKVFYAYRLDGSVTIHFKRDTSDHDTPLPAIMMSEIENTANLVWVCLVEDRDGNVARGLSVLSRDDNPTREGYIIAEQRAIRA
jgi:hypothetical protein